ncbi:MAG: hypothetical protein H6636_06035 [Anaerolineales bacterium]|nr:hypothetical protein [Anaerolineales bacterium]
MILKWIYKLFTPLRRSLVLLGLVAMGTSGFYLKNSMLLSPGPLSGVDDEQVILGTYQTHAEFEKDCAHCHAPVHCLEETRCQECHFEVAQQRAAQEGLHGRLPITRCQTCHTEHKGRDAEISDFAFQNVDHTALAGFSLTHHQQDYAGNALNCEGCHSQDTFVHETLDCITCHLDENPAYMAGHLAQYGEDCLPCHDGHDRYSDFDHNEFYVLDGAHVDLACETCHVNQVYAGTPNTCVGCHEDPDVHLGVFGEACERCHTTAAWLPAQLTQHTFRLNHGGQGELACSTCHTESYAAHTCYACHDHQPEQMQAVHENISTEELENCIACHPTGEPGEAK